MEYFDLSDPPDTTDEQITRLFQEAELARSARSAILDLQDVDRCLNIWLDIAKIDASPNDPFAWDKDPFIRDTASCVLQTAVISYFRIVDSSSLNGRSAASVSKALHSPELKAADRRVKSHRHTSIAHHGRPGHETPFWNKTRITFVLERAANKGCFVYPHSRLKGPVQLVKDLAALVDALSPVLSAWWQKHEKRVQIKLVGLSRKGALSDALLSRFDPEEFFLSKHVEVGEDYVSVCERAMNAGFDICADSAPELL